jgi:hypothetical protein
MMVAFGHSLRDISSSDHRDNGEDEDDEETEQVQLSEDDETGWVMGTINQTVQQRLDRFRQKLMKLDELTQPEWEDAADYFHERYKTFSTSDLKVPAVVQPQMDDDAAAPALTTFG